MSTIENTADRDAETDDWGACICPQCYQIRRITPDSSRQRPVSASHASEVPVEVPEAVRASEAVLPRLYVSGPMSGIEDFNRPAFHAAAAQLRSVGYEVVNPAEVDLGEDASWADYMRIHLATITSGEIDGLALLTGWINSKGARLEHRAARAFGMDTKQVRSWIEDAPEPVDPDAEALDQMAQAMANLDGSDDADEWVPWAEVALDALRETHDVTPRAEQ